MTFPLLFIALLIVGLLVPYRWSRERTFGGRRGLWQSALYTYSYGPGYERFELTGGYQIQRWLMLILTTIIKRLQPELIAWLITWLRSIFQF